MGGGGSISPGLLLWVAEEESMGCISRGSWLGVLAWCEAGMHSTPAAVTGLRRLPWGVSLVE